MQIPKRIFIAVVSFFLFTTAVFANTLQFTADSTAAFTVGNCTIKSGSKASSIDISANTLTVIMTTGNEFVLNCPAIIQLTSVPSVGETCEANGTRTYRQTSGAATLTTNFTAASITTACGAYVSNNNNQPGGGGSGGSASSQQTTTTQITLTTPITPTTPTTTITTPTTGTPTPAITQRTQRPFGFSDVNPAGSSRLSAANARIVLDMAKAMIDNRAFTQVSKFKPFTYISRHFAIQTALGAVARRSCGSRINTSTCLAAASQNNIVDEDDLPSNRLTRAEFYKMLLAAAGLPLISESQVAANLCSDVRANNEFARVIASAKFYGIASTSGSRCLANKRFKRYEAMLYASRTLQAMSRR